MLNQETSRALAAKLENVVPISKAGMTTPTTLAEAWDECLIEAVPSDATAEQVATFRRAFFRGALAAMGLPPEQLRAELVGHGRSVGSQAERAQVRTDI